MALVLQFCRKRLNDTMQHMKEGIAGKIGNANSNAFKLRKLFAMQDKDKTGMVCIVRLPLADRSQHGIAVHCQMTVISAVFHLKVVTDML